MTDGHKTSSIDRCRIIDLPRHMSDNGALTEVENSGAYPFDVRRAFYLYDVPAATGRGGHSHRWLQLLLVAVSGSFKVTLHDGHRSRTFTLDRPYQGLYIESGIWNHLHDFSAGSVCLALASDKYDEADYVRDFEDFLALTAKKEVSAGKMRYPFMDLRDTNAPYIDLLKDAALRVIESGRYVGGEENEAFECELAQMHDVPHAIGVSNGLDALRLILRACIEMGRIAPGDEVIVPANTYIASVLAVTDCGLKPVFVEPDPLTLNLDTAKVEQAITERTRAVMPVHLYGRACWDSRLAEVARRHGLLVIEDNAQAIGARSVDAGLYGGHITGALGDAAAFSFYPTKNIGALGDAGAVLTRDADLAAAVRALSNYGSDRRYHNIYAGLNCRLDPIQAAMLRVKLAHIDEETAHRREIAWIYHTHIDNPAVTLPLYDDLCVWHQYVVRVANRDDFRRYLADNGVGTDVHYAVPPHRQPCYSEYAHLHLPVTDRLAAEVVSLPVGRGTSAADARDIAEIIRRYER